MIDEDICKILYIGGCREIGLGVEVANDPILKVIGKNELVADHKRAIKIAKDCGLKVKIFMMAGLPFEIWDTIEQNKEFIEETKPDKVVVSLFTPFPGCDIFENPAKYDITIRNINWSEYVQSYPTKSLISHSKCTSEELTEHHKEMIKFVEGYNDRTIYY